MFNRSTRYFTLALTLVALTATVRPAHADDPCSNPGSVCVVGGTDPQPTGQAVQGSFVVGGTDPQPTGGDSQSMDDLISYLMVGYGLA